LFGATATNVSSAARRSIVTGLRRYVTDRCAACARCTYRARKGFTRDDRPEPVFNLTATATATAARTITRRAAAAAAACAAADYSDKTL
jgi:ferredoxin